jgi:hypothetical protein
MEADWPEYVARTARMLNEFSGDKTPGVVWRIILGFRIDIVKKRQLTEYAVFNSIDGIVCRARKEVIYVCLCGCFGNMCTCIYCVLYFLYCVFLLFLLCIVIIIIITIIIIFVELLM